VTIRRRAVRTDADDVENCPQQQRSLSTVLARIQTAVIEVTAGLVATTVRERARRETKSNSPTTCDRWRFRRFAADVAGYRRSTGYRPAAGLGVSTALDVDGGGWGWSCRAGPGGAGSCSSPARCVGEWHCSVVAVRTSHYACQWLQQQQQQQLTTALLNAQAPCLASTAPPSGAVAVFRRRDAAVQSIVEIGRSQKARL